MSSICGSCKATHVTDFLSSPVELFGTHIQVGRSTPSATIDAHAQHRGRKCACAPLHNVVHVLPPTGELCVDIRTSNLKETADPGSYIRISLPAMRVCACLQFIFIQGHMGICAPSSLFHFSDSKHAPKCSRDSWHHLHVRHPLQIWAQTAFRDYKHPSLLLTHPPSPSFSSHSPRSCR